MVEIFLDREEDGLATIVTSGPRKTFVSEVEQAQRPLLLLKLVHVDRNIRCTLSLSSPVTQMKAYCYNRRFCRIGFKDRQPSDMTPR